MEAWLPARPSNILDMGCGTGSLSLVLADLGHAVTGVDLSPAMIALARKKAAAAGRSIAFGILDAAQPGLKPASFDVIVCRHLLWMLPGPGETLSRWMQLLKPGGRLILVEGFWGTGAGLHMEQITAALPASMTIAAQNLSGSPEFWGQPVRDERYLVAADKPDE